MGVETRIDYQSPQGVGGGGGGPPTGGGLATIGPDYGQNAKGVDPDGITKRATVARAFDSVEHTATKDLVAVRALDSVEHTATKGLVATRSIDAVEHTAAKALSVSKSGTLVVTGMAPDEDTYLSEGEGDRWPNIDLFARTPDALGDGEQVIYIAWDCTDVQGTVLSASIDLFIETTALIAENAPYEVRITTVKPFEEETATYANDEPVIGSLMQSGTVEAPATQAYRTVTLNGTARFNLPGNWVFIRVDGAGALGTSTIIVDAFLSEVGTPNFPRLNLEVALT